MKILIFFYNSILNIFYISFLNLLLASKIVVYYYIVFILYCFKLKLLFFNKFRKFEIQNEKFQNFYSSYNKQKYFDTKQTFLSKLNNKRRCATNHYFFLIISSFKSLLEILEIEDNKMIEIDKCETSNNNFNKNSLFFENGRQRRLTIKVLKLIFLLNISF